MARFTNMLQGQRDLATVGRMLLSELAPLINAQNGVIYLVDAETTTPGLTCGCSHPMRMRAIWDIPAHLHIGEGLIGQCAADGSACC